MRLEDQMFKKKKRKAIKGSLKLMAAERMSGPPGSRIERLAYPLCGYRMMQDEANPFIFTCPACGRPAAWAGILRTGKKVANDLAALSVIKNVFVWLERIWALSMQEREALQENAKLKKWARLEFHHDLPVSRFPQFENNAANLRPICSKCHHNVEMAGAAAQRFVRMRR